MAVDDDTPLPLKEAAERAFPAGGVSAIMLRRQIENGNLKGYRVGRAVLTTLKDVADMVARGEIKPPRKVDWHANYSEPNGLGLTEKDIAKSELDRALDNLGSIAHQRAKAKLKKVREGVPKKGRK